VVNTSPTGEGAGVEGGFPGDGFDSELQALTLSVLLAMISANRRRGAHTGRF
jgi:hypothetical protein